MRRVVVTGIAGVTPLGSSWDEISERLWSGQSAVTVIPEWEGFAGLKSRTGSPVTGWNPPPHFGRKVLRSMGRGAAFATWSAEEALRSAGLLGSAELQGGRTGVAYGSCLGSAEALTDIAKAAVVGSFEGIPASSFLRVMSHSAAANIALYFNLSGRVLPLCSACTSATQSIGAAVESIRAGAQDIMIAGGCDELCVGLAALFDSMAASGNVGSAIPASPLPFDRRRSGIVIGEGAATLILEEYEHALRRGAPIISELSAYATNCNGTHITNPDPERMETVMRAALTDANLQASDIGIIHAHATGTELGDIAEGQATYRVFGEETPITALKGHLGHTLGACGAIESWLMLEMMRVGRFAAIRGLTEPDERCGPLNFIRDTDYQSEVSSLMVNTFAFGGVNTSVIFQKVIPEYPEQRTVKKRRSGAKGGMTRTKLERITGDTWPRGASKKEKYSC